MIKSAKKTDKNTVDYRKSFFVDYENGATCLVTLDKQTHGWAVSGVKLMGNCPICKRFDNSNCKCLDKWVDRKATLDFIMNEDPD